MADHKQVIQLILNEYEKLEFVVNKLDSYRFHVASLLMIYEGSLLDGGRAIVYLIDFAKSSFRGLKEGKVHVVGTDEDFIKRVTILIEVSNEIYNEL